ncbi:MAG: hypothetical protein CMO61_13725 [Verrucomicrobiales bacterium]|jgi:hypothetical protein|nr:hypothetical protein [Verrucomicrobiales bacterium]|tara:strand:- start:23335 stop:23970 length:636 start_codon:yes stop_codon:yes gene_type:complete
MVASSIIDTQPKLKKINADRIGVVASTLCAIHCAVTPPLLLLLPAFGEVWAHPATHWGMALLVVPIAIAMIISGYRQHRRKWIVAVGSLGVSLVLIGAALPYLQSSETIMAAAVTPTPASLESEASLLTSEGESSLVSAEDNSMPAESGHDESCATDACCPSFTTDADGNTKLKFPASSIVTTLGGVALIITHVGNLCGCASCRRRRDEES